MASHLFILTYNKMLVSLGHADASAGPPVGLVRRIVDLDHNDESLFVGRAYFLRANDPREVHKTKTHLIEHATEGLVA